MKCPNCGHVTVTTSVVPPEPPIGTWVRDRYGAAALHHTYGGVTGWAPPGAWPYGKWEAMWEARGPLVVCGPWGEELAS